LTFFGTARNVKLGARVLKKVLIANRGEIAVRIARTLRELEIGSVAVFTEADRAGHHLRFADEAVPLGDDPRAYLDVERIVDAARSAGADGLHPGYGFLSENAKLAEACERAGITFVGPPASAISAMGSKQRARAAATAAAVPVVPGGGADSLDEARASAARVGYPVLVKAVDGGGGKGMRRVESEAELAAALERTRSEALASFGSDAVYIEKALERPRHVEIQVLGDKHGTLVPLFERDCSIQRRHQKVVEETPCPVLAASTLDAMSEVALRISRAIGYFSAGTCEFLLDADGAFYFLEMNTRLQVEHPITELVTGLDLVEQMVRVAAGESIAPTPPPRRGAAIEVRVYAEDPEQAFFPSPGTIEYLAEPGGPGVRVDSGVGLGSVVGSDYDPLLAKLVVFADDRPRAVARLARALSEYAILGVTTNLSFLQNVVTDAAFRRGDYDTSFVEGRPELRSPRLTRDEQEALGVALAALEHDRPSMPRRSTPDRLSPWVLAERARLR